MILLRLYFEFFRVGLFSVGGGLATIPFLTDLGTRTGWFTPAELANMVAVSESTPGPMGVNMATYVGFETNGPMGCVIATLGLFTPSIIIILVIARFLQKFRQSRTVDAVFYGLRPASTALIASAGFLSVAKVSLLFWQEPLPEPGILFTHLFNWKSIALFALVFLGLNVPRLKKLHPILFIAFGALVGILFRF